MIWRNLKLTYSPVKRHIPQGSSGPISNNNNENFGEAQAQTNCLSLYVWHLLLPFALAVQLSMPTL